MTRMKYTEKLAARIAATRSALCVGLDPRPQTENMTELADWLRRFCKRKWNSEFSREMSRSCTEMVRDWCK